MRVFVKHGLVAAHAGEVIHVARLGHANNRMDEKVRLRFFRGAEGQFLMRAVEWVAGLEGHNLAPTKLAEIGAQFVRCVAACAEIIVDGLLNAGYRAAKVNFARSIVQVVHRGVGVVIGAENLFGFARFVRNPAVRDGHGRENHALLIAQGDILVEFEGFCEVFGHIKSNRHRPELTVRKAHVFDNAIIVLFRQEPFERVEAAIHKELKIANLARCQVVADKVCGFDFEFLRTIV